MTNDVKVFIGVIIATLLLVFGAAFFLGKNNSPTTPFVGDQQKLIRSDSWNTGSESAKITLVEFSDFQCPACKAASPAVKSVLTKYGENLRFVYRHFPLPSHEFGFISAQAAEAAGLQGKFWEMHDKLFELSPDLKKENLLTLAKDLGLNLDKFNSDLDSDTVRQKVLNDQADGNSLGINATPTFFVNGTKLVGTSNLDSEISKLLK